MRALEDILQSTSETLFPADLGERRVSLNSRDCDGDTPLHVMLWRRDYEAVLALIAAGAPVNAVGDMGETPLHVAITKRNTHVISALLAAGSDPRIRCEFGDTAQERAMAIGGEIAGLFL